MHPTAAQNHLRQDRQDRHAGHNLPHQATPLVGRGREVEAVCATLRRPEVRLLTLFGPPGIGKTRLSIHAASLLLDDFPDGVWFVPLAAITDPDLVPYAITQALELRGATDESMPERLRTYLQGKHLLLLLDNFEQVVKAAPLLSDLLAHSPGVKMLVTSRELLQLYGEHDYPVPPLSLPDLDRLPDLAALSDYEAIELFLQRAQAVNPGFQLTDRNAPAVAEICLRLDGLPLAIELAAARVLVLQPEDLLARLKSRLTLLKGGARNLPERQRTLQAAIDWSYNLLEPAEQTLFRRLGIFVDGYTLEAVEEVCATGDLESLGLDTLDGVASLVGKSLLQRQESTGAHDDGRSQRFFMLETLREYARQKLEEAGELDAAADRHLHYYLRFAETAEQGLRGNEQLRWMQRVDTEVNNLRAALEWSLSRDDLVQNGLRMAPALGRYWQTKGYLSEGRDWCEQLLSKAEQTGQSELSIERVKALRTLAFMVFEQGNFIEARSILEQCLEMSRALGYDWGVASALNGLGPVALWLGEYDLSLSLIQEALAIFRRLGDKPSASNTLTLSGTILMLKGEYRAAQVPLDESLAISRELGSDLGITSTLSELGSVAFHLGDNDRARALLEESLGLARELGVDWVIAKVIARLGTIALRQGDPREAEALSLEGLDRYRRSGNKRWTRWYLVALAEVARLRGQPERAAKLIGMSEGPISAAGGHYEPGMRAEIERITASVRAELDEETFERLRDEGRSMPPEDAVVYALEPFSQRALGAGQVQGSTERVPGGATSAAQPYPDDLTERELEVLRLIAAGKSNQEIAQDLVLSLRTVERHISNIYQKIGATGRIARATATAYALRLGLTS